MPTNFLTSFSAGTVFALTLFAPDCYKKLKTFSQMNPPLRSKDHYDKLWEAVKNSSKIC